MTPPTGPSRRELILHALLARVGEISATNGFNTDCGATVLLGEAPDLGPDDAPVVLAIVPQDDVPTFTGMNIRTAWPIEFQAIADASKDISRAWLLVEQLVADIQRAIELEDRTLGGLVQKQFERGPIRRLEREPGSTTVGAAVPYVFPFVVAWGNP